MHSLFWKIFITFWLSLILFAAASIVAVSFYLEHTHAQQDRDTPRNAFRTHLESARTIAELEGREGLVKWLQKLDRSEAIPYLLIDKSGNEILDRKISSHQAMRLKRHLQQPDSSKRKQSWWHRGEVKLPDGTQYRLVPDFQGATLGRALSRPRVIAIPVLVAAVISGLVCFLLVRYLTTPVLRLSEAVRQFSDGDLGMRVRPSMGRRKDEIAELANDFDRMAERLQELIRSHKQLLNDVSHELRSPLARLQVALGLARQSASREDNPELDRIEREAERLNEMIGQLLSLARLDSGAVPTNLVTVDLETILAEVVDNADYEASALNRHVRVSKSSPVSVEADEGLLRSALENVVRNAVHYTSEGTSVDITLSSMEKRQNWIEIRVTDHGLGVPDEMLSGLFEPFMRVDDARDRESGGYGLGLAIAKRAINKHGGEIFATNTSHGGLMVSILLPVTQAT